MKKLMFCFDPLFKFIVPPMKYFQMGKGKPDVCNWGGQLQVIRVTSFRFLRYALSENRAVSCIIAARSASRITYTIRRMKQ